MKCDELKKYKAYEFGTSYVYHIEEVYAAIAELKQKLHDAEMQADLSECAVTEYKIDCDKLKDENRRLKRALWLARAERANEIHFMWCQLIYDKKYGIVKFNVRKNWGENVKQGQTLHTPQGWADVWDKVEYRCRAKAERYK